MQTRTGNAPAARETMRRRGGAAPAAPAESPAAQGAVSPGWDRPPPRVHRAFPRADLAPDVETVGLVGSALRRNKVTDGNRALAG